MTTLFDGAVGVSYYQFYIQSPSQVDAGSQEYFSGQSNGLCGAAVSGLLNCTTGIHTGEAPVKIELLNGPPADRHGLPGDWEEIVEVSTVSQAPNMILADWGHEQEVPLALGQGSFRVRYHASGMQVAKEADVRLPGQPILDRYFLQFWPAAPQSDIVLRVTSNVAASWHAIASSTATIPGSDALEGASRLAEQQERASFDIMIQTVTARRSAAVQRSNARWLAHRAVELAAEVVNPQFVSWIAPGLAAMDSDLPLPRPWSESQPDYSELKAAVTDMAQREHDSLESRERARKAATFTIRTLQATDRSDPAEAFMNALAMVQNVRPELQAELRIALVSQFT